MKGGITATTAADGRVYILGTQDSGKPYIKLETAPGSGEFTNWIDLNGWMKGGITATLPMAGNYFAMLAPYLPMRLQTRSRAMSAWGSEEAKSAPQATQLTRASSCRRQQKIRRAGSPSPQMPSA